jgi:hypothetical protein
MARALVKSIVAIGIGGRAEPLRTGVTSIIGGITKLENGDDVPNRASRIASWYLRTISNRLSCISGSTFLRSFSSNFPAYSSVKSSIKTPGTAKSQYLQLAHTGCERKGVGTPTFHDLCRKLDTVVFDPLPTQGSNLADVLAAQNDQADDPTVSGLSAWSCRYAAC